MKTKLLCGFIGLVLRAFLMGFVMYQMAPGMMLLEDESKYDFEQSVDESVKATKAKGWKIPATHDLKKSMEKFGFCGVKDVKVFELCHLDHAMKILERNNERIVSTMMPCRVAIYTKDDGKTYFSRMNSSLMAGTMGGIIASVMDEAAKQNEEILDAIWKRD